jgi:predicted DsbA family dithiol-disulfide isomerase
VLVEIARRIGLDMARFERDLDDPSTADAVSAERDSASSVPVRSTPTLVLNGRVIEGGLAWETLAAAIDAATAPAPSTSPAP